MVLSRFLLCSCNHNHLRHTIGSEAKSHDTLQPLSAFCFIFVSLSLWRQTHHFHLCRYCWISDNDAGVYIRAGKYKARHGQVIRSEAFRP
ncbi:hypothetical protein BDW72DRAFT_41190 [Aspergillus terricola var. indicus]